MSLFLQSIRCVGREFINSIDSIRHLSLSIQWWFRGLQRLCFFWWFMVQHRHRVFDNSVRQPWLYFLLSIWCVGHEFIDAVNSIRQFSLNIHWWFWQQWLCFRWRLRDKPWHIVFDNSMHQPWLYFCYRFHASVLNSLTLSIPYVGCHSVFVDDFMVYSDSVFAEDL